MNFPTQLTVLRIILTPVFLFLIFIHGFNFKLLAFLVFIIASLTDWYDGYYARKFGTVSKWGKFLDPLADKILVSAALFAFYSLGYIKLWVVIIIVARDFLITGLRSYALFKQRPVVTSQLARVKTFVQMGSVFIIFIYMMFDHLALSRDSQFQMIELLTKIQFIDRMMVFVVFLTVYTAIMYLIENRNHVTDFLKACFSVFKPSGL
ncbi:MAG: CDP-diacylglycerol--glycerol-3-phosphate 3-phosphatidyltransferase [Candidatus Zhuqueibacterota bacterium]